MFGCLNFKTIYKIHRKLGWLQETNVGLRCVLRVVWGIYLSLKIPSWTCPQMLSLFPTNESCPYFQRTLLHHITHYYCTYTCTSQEYKSQNHRYRICLTWFSNIHHKILKYITRYLNISQAIEQTLQDLEYILQDLRMKHVL